MDSELSAFWAPGCAVLDHFLHSQASNGVNQQQLRARETEDEAPVLLFRIRVLAQVL